MDILQQCAQEFERLLSFHYHVIIGRKGKTVEFTLSFEPSDFHHLAGLHKLKDNVRFLTGKREHIMYEILTGKLTLAQAQQRIHFKEMESRLKPLANLEYFLDSNQIIFRYNPKIHFFSVIQADYLLENHLDGSSVYLFLSQRTGQSTQVCRTFFPKSNLDYTKQQPRYTLLKKNQSCYWRNHTPMRQTFQFQMIQYKLIDIIFFNTYNPIIQQATTCVCQSDDIRKCAGMHCLMELSGGVVQ